MEKNPVLVLFDLGCDFEEAKDDGRGLRLGQGGMLQGVRTEGMMDKGRRSTPSLNKGSCALPERFAVLTQARCRGKSMRQSHW